MMKVLALALVLCGLAGVAHAQQGVYICSKGATTCTPVTATNPLPVQTNAGPSTVILQKATTVLATNLVVKAAPGDLYSFDVSADATLSAGAWAVLIYNATSAPGDGTVTPAKCYLLPAGTTTLTGAFPNAPAFTTGIVIAVSTGQTCYTQSSSTHAFLSADYE